MSLTLDDFWQFFSAFYLGGYVLAALVATVPGALVEKKSCATLERLHFLLFFFGGAALIVYLHGEIIRAVVPQNLWIANFSMAVVAGLYLGNVTARRLRNAGKKSILALLIWVPVVNVLFLIALAAMPTAPKKARPAMDVAALPESGHLEASS